MFSKFVMAGALTAYTNAVKISQVMKTPAYYEWNAGAQCADNASYSQEYCDLMGTYAEPKPEGYYRIGQLEFNGPQHVTWESCEAMSKDINHAMTKGEQDCFWLFDGEDGVPPEYYDIMWEADTNYDQCVSVPELAEYFFKWNAAWVDIDEETGKEHRKIGELVQNVKEVTEEDAWNMASAHVHEAEADFYHGQPAHNGALEEAEVPPEYQAMWKLADADGDGSVSVPELATFYQDHQISEAGDHHDGDVPHCKCMPSYPPNEESLCHDQGDVGACDMHYTDCNWQGVFGMDPHQCNAEYVEYTWQQTTGSCQCTAVNDKDINFCQSQNWGIKMCMAVHNMGRCGWTAPEGVEQAQCADEVEAMWSDAPPSKTDKYLEENAKYNCEHFGEDC